ESCSWFGPLTMDETTRTNRPTMEAACSLLSAPAAQAWRPVEGRPHHSQRHLLAAEYRRPLARPARTLRQVEDGPRPLLHVAQVRVARRHLGGAPAAPGPAGPDRLRPVVCRWLLHPRQPSSRGCFFKKKVEGEPADHARGGFGTKIHLATDGNGLPLAAEIS